MTYYDYGEVHYSHTWKVDRGPGDADFPYDWVKESDEPPDPRPVAMLEERYFPPLPHLWNGYLVVDAGGHGDGCLVALSLVPPYGDLQGSAFRTLCGYGWGRPSKLVEPECSICARRVLGEAVVANGDYSAHDEYPTDDPRRDDDEDIYGPWNDVR